MSKPMTRVAVSVLIAAILLIALYTTVQGGLGRDVVKSEPNRAQAHVVNGLMTNLNHDRSSVTELEMAAAQEKLYSQPLGRGEGHGCRDHDLRFDPND
ncbi:MAG TPA: hypothetical protein VFO91_19715 [Anaerolineales bacterium]|nr:hypothetical protein [Anaerolineales bacterium]